MSAPRTRKRLPWSVMAFMAVLGLVIALNAVHVVGGLLLAKTVRRTVAEEGVVTIGSSGEAVFLRRELILVTPQAGVWHPKVVKGEKVPAGTNVGEVLNPKLLDRARQLQEKARGEKTAWESELQARQHRLDQTLIQVNEKIQLLLAELKSGGPQQQTAPVQAQNDKLQVLLRQRGRLLTEKEQLNQEAAGGGQWRQTETEAKELMALATTPVVTPLAGRFEVSLDGYEDAFDPLEYKVALTALTPSSPLKPAPASAGDYVDSGRAVGKIIQEEPTFARVSFQERVDLLALDDRVDLCLRATQVQLSAKVVALAHQESESVAVLKLINAPPELSSVREAEAEVIYQQVRGTVVPEKSLTYQDGQEGVYRWHQGKWSFTPVRVLAVDKGQAVVSGLKPGAEIAVGLRF
ncbi:MAG TPA: hypothetical protein GX016_09155 [Firmicutes bacterium]|jgi:putative membrane fusion protein|nr:hypothetical protein [Bacillota bacterium]